MPARPWVSEARSVLADARVLRRALFTSKGRVETWLVVGRSAS